MTQTLLRAGIRCHVWERRELESCLLSPEAIARISGADTEEVERLLERSAEKQRYRLEAQHVANAGQDVSPGGDLTGLIEEARVRFGGEWLMSRHRWHLADTADLTSTLNGSLSAGGWQTVPVFSLAQAHRAGDLAPEMIRLLTSLDRG